MTFVIGAHLGDAVGVLADTRVTVHRSSGVEYFDNALKVYQRPPLLIGLAGDAIASDLLVTKFQLRYLVSTDAVQAYAHAVDGPWMFSNLLATYDDVLKERLIHPDTRFSLIIAAENSAALEHDSVEVRNFIGTPNATISASVSSVSVDEREAGQRLVFAIDFPSRRIEKAGPGAAVIRGSGRVSEVFLRARHSVLVGHQLSFGDRLASIARDMLVAAEGLKDPSFNALVLGWARSYGYAESVLQNLIAWPEHSAPPESYIWEAFNPEDMIPEVGLYAIGSDLHNFELGWVFDTQNKRKLRVQSVTKERLGKDDHGEQYMI